MKHLVLCLGLSLNCSLGSLMAQHTLPAPLVQREALVQHFAIGHNYIGLKQQLRDLPSTFASADQLPYLRALSQLLEQHQSDEQVLQLWLEQHPSSMDVERARLLLALVYHERGDRARSSYHLERIQPDGLDDSEASQYFLLRSHYLLEQEGRRALGRARTWLEQATQGHSIWGERALLYLSCLNWEQGQTQLAQSLLRDHPWHPTLAPEAAYLTALMAYSHETPSVAIGRTQELQRRYPDLLKRPRLQGAMGQAYYSLGDYPNAIRTLSAQPLETLSPDEAYVLGAAHYQTAAKQGSKGYGRAIPALQRASQAKGERGAWAQFALANAYRVDGQDGQAQLALSAALEHAEAPRELREEALYQIIEIGFSRGYDAFGSQIRQTERFLSEYPTSRHRARILELLRGYFTVGKDYQSKLDFIRRLEARGERLSEAKQDVLVRLASTLPTDSAAYLSTLEEAIALGGKHEAHAIALVMRSAWALERGRYSQAERDAASAMSLERSRPAYQSGLAAYLHGYALYNQKQYSAAYKSLDKYSQGTAQPALRADALCRMGDCLLGLSGQQEQAMACYRRAEALYPDGAAEALYRMAGIYRQKGEYDKQIETIDRALERYPESAHTAGLLYDKGRALLVGRGRSAEAEEIFASLESRFPSSPSAPLAALERALIQSNKGDEDRAIEAYKHVISTYPDSPEAETALADLKSLYAEANRLDEYAAFASRLSTALGSKAGDALHLHYLALESRLRRQEEGAAETLQDFVREHPNSPDRYRAEWLLIDHYTHTNQPALALEQLRVLGQQTLAPEQALSVQSRLGDLLAAQGYPAEAVKAYEQAYKLASGAPERSLEIGQRLVETALTSGAFTLATTTAQQLLSRTGLPVEAEQRLILSLGKAQEGNKAVKTALTTYARLNKWPDTPQGAEAMVRRADLMLRLGQAKEVQQLLESFVATGTPEQYWLARAFVLLADSCERQGDLYLAKQYILSLKDNYQDPEADILEMIEQRLTKYTQKQ